MIQTLPQSKQRLLQILKALAILALLGTLTSIVASLIAIGNDNVLDIPLNAWIALTFVTVIMGTVAVFGYVQTLHYEYQYYHMRALRSDRRSKALILDAEDNLRRQQKQNRLTQMLMHVAEVANQAEMISDAVQCALEEISNYTGWEVGHAYIYDPQKASLISLDVWHSTDESKYDSLRAVLGANDTPLVTPLANDTYCKGAVSWGNCTQHIPDALQPLIALHAFEGMMALPIIVGDEVVTVMEFFTTDTETPDRKLFHVLKHLSEQLAHTIARKQSEEKAKLFEEVITNANDGVLITKADILDAPQGPEIVYVNEALCQISGYNKDELIGQTPRILQGEESDRKTLSEIRHAVTHGTHYRGELVNYSKHGEPYWLGLSIVPIRNLQGSITHYAAIERDITAKKQAESKLRNAVSEAERANMIKSEFLANMSHELRTPMSGILGMVNLLRDSTLDAEQQELVNIITNSSNDLLALLNDILDISKVESGDVRVEQVTFDLHNGMHTMKRFYEATAQDKTLKLELHIADNVPQCVVGDYTKLQQIMRNLIGNAIKFTESGTITVNIATLSEFHEEGVAPQLYFYVKDSGIGIAEDRLGDIFNKFTQADNSISRKYGGTGLGLAITKELVELMGGQIGVESRENDGSIFYFSMPLTLPADDAVPVNIIEHADTLKEIDEVCAKDAAILVVDDHPINRLFAKKLLSKMNYTNIDFAEDGTKALAMLSRTDYAIVLMDCQMPDIDGYEATRRWRKQEKAHNYYVPIIALTANAMVGDKQKCLNAGMDDYLTKPLKQEELQTVLNHWLVAPNTPVAAEGTERPEYLIDFDHLAIFTDGDKAEEAELFALFLEQSENTLRALLEAKTARNVTQWKEAAHRLKGSAANLGAKILADTCQKAEQTMPDNEEQMQVLLDDIEIEYSKLRHFMVQSNGLLHVS